MDTYHVGKDSIQIRLSVDITTTGLAATTAILLIVASTDPGIPVAKSSEASGDIAATVIGLPAVLVNKRLSIFTKISLTGSDLQARKQEFERLTAKYSLSGGEDGEKTYQDPVRSADAEYFTAFLQENIDLI